MKLMWDAMFGEVILAASAEELDQLAAAVAAGQGELRASASSSADALAGVRVVGTPGPGVSIRLDPVLRVLLVSGDAAGRGVLAENLHGMATAEDGGHLHIDYFPDHLYLAEGSLQLIVNSPHGGMPRRP